MIRFNPRNARGFTLMEMAVVLVIIAVLIGGVSVGRDVYRSAVAERIGSQFIQGWMLAYDQYVAQVGGVPADDIANPTGKVNKGSSALCRDNLRDEMLRYGITLPEGRAEGLESRYVYQDAAGLPRELEVCFQAVPDWAEPTAGNAYLPRPRNVMRLTGLTPELARQLDVRIDGNINARFGRVREVGSHNLTSAVSAPPPEFPWSRNEKDNRTHANDTGQVLAVDAYLKLNR